METQSDTAHGPQDNHQTFTNDPHTLQDLQYIVLGVALAFGNAHSFVLASHQEEEFQKPSAVLDPS